MAITITLSHEIETLQALRDEWIELQSKSSATGMSLAWHWIHIWYKHFKVFGELWLITAREDGRLIGIAPLMIVEEQPYWGFAWRQIEFIGSPLDQEHLDFIIERGYEKQVISLFTDKLYEHRSQWDVIKLTGLCDTKTPHILQQSDREWVKHSKKSMIAPYTELPDTMDEWMLAISRNHRKKLRRYRKKMDEQFPDRWSITQVTLPHELNYTFDHLVRLHQSHWETRGASGTFYYGEFAEYFKELAHCMLENGWLRMYRLDIDGKPCAINFCYHYFERAYNHIAGVDRDITDVALGHIVTHHSIGQAIEEGLSEMTFMWGEMPWKYSFGAVNRVHQAFRLIDSTRVQLQVNIVNELRVVKSHIRKMASDRSTNKVDPG